MSVKNWIVHDPFHKNKPVVVILAPGMIRPSGSGSFFEASVVAEAAEVKEAREVSKA